MKLNYSYDPDGGLVYVADQDGDSSVFVIDGLPVREALTKLWALACTFDDMPVDTRIAVFSEENQYNKMHGSSPDVQVPQTGGAVMIYVPLYKPDPSLIAAIRAAIQRHKLTSNATLARRVVAARRVA